LNDYHNASSGALAASGPPPLAPVTLPHLTATPNR
jgi:hypothetical protein